MSSPHSATLLNISPVAIGVSSFSVSLRMTAIVVCAQRFLQPHQVELVEDAARAQRLGEVPLLVGIDHDRNVVADVLAHRGHPLDVVAKLRLADP